MLWSAGALLPALLTYLLLLLLMLYCWFRWSHRELLRAAANLPVVVPTWPLLGHCYLIFGGRDGFANALLDMARKVAAQGLKITSFWLGPLPLISVYDVDDVQTILSSSSLTDKSDEYEYFKIGFDSEAGPLSHNLLTAPATVWKVTRKHINPLFHPRNLQHMIPVFNRNSRELVSCLSAHVGHGFVNVMPHTMDTALKTVCNLLFGPEVNIDIRSSDFQGLISVVEMIPDLFITRLMRLWLRNETLFRFLYRHELKQLNTYWNNFTNTRIKKVHEVSQRKRLNVNNLSNTNHEDTPVTISEVPEPLNIVDVYSEMQKTHPEFTEADMRYEVLILYCTGTDTVGSTVASCFLALAHFQDVQERLYQEISSAVGPGDDVTLQDLNRMPYLDQVLKETLRWFLTVPFMLRKSVKDIKLSTCTIPKGSTVVICLGGIHMSHKLYPDPDKFDPDRFNAPRSAGKERFTFLPFSGGPRDCIGKAYAMQLMKIMVVHVLRRYKLSTDMDIFKLRKRLVVTLVNADGYRIALEERS